MWLGADFVVLGYMDRRAVFCFYYRDDLKDCGHVPMHMLGKSRNDRRSGSAMVTILLETSAKNT